MKASPAPKRLRDEFTDLRLGTRAALHRLTDSLVGQRLSPRDWFDFTSNELVGAHAEAWRIGRVLSGDDSPLDDVDRLAGRAVMDQQGEYLLRFVDDLESGRYGPLGDLRGSAVQARAAMYADALRGTSNRAYVESVPLTEAWVWSLGAVEEHCVECPVLAGMSPWLGQELAYVPGEGGTPCLSNCKCTLVRASTGAGGIPPW